MDSKNIYDDDSLSHLDSLDEKHGINTGKIEESKVEKDKPAEKVTSLGKVSSLSTVSEVSESPWKIINMDLLPSKGMFYPEGSELLIRSAKTREIRHWSTMDENDPIDVIDKINFILNSCTRFKIRGANYMFNFNDFCDIDRYHILFRIYELTFPNKENKIVANVECSKCTHVNSVQVTSKNLLGYNIPEDYLKYYNESEKCFVVDSNKLGETLKFYMPTSGSREKLRARVQFDRKSSIDLDESFYKISPYLVDQWRDLNNQVLGQTKITLDGWSGPKFNAVNRFVTDMELASTNRVTGICEKCKNRMESSIFLGGSFTVKDIFIISARFDELI